MTGPAKQINSMFDYIAGAYGPVTVGGATYTLGGKIPTERERDAAVLQMAASVLRKRSRQTFTSRVIIRVLELHAERLEGKP